LRTNGRPDEGPTPYRDVNELLQFYKREIESKLGQHLEGLYLTGSLSYGAFNQDTSDIDIVAIVQEPLSQRDIGSVRRLHVQMMDQFGKWARRLECSYTPIAMLSSIAPPKEPRPYWGSEGTFYEAASYGNEWIINNYLLYQYGISLQGPGFRELIGPVQVEEVQKACIRDLFQEWEPKANDEHWFKNSHYASYFVLNLCRILYTVTSKDVGSKKIAAAWTKARYGEAWRSLIEAAEDWRYGTELDIYDQAITFLNFVIGEVSKTALYRELADEIGDLRRSSGS
jgi:hypothetical protein